MKNLESLKWLIGTHKFAVSMFTVVIGLVIIVNSDKTVSDYTNGFSIASLLFVAFFFFLQVTELWEKSLPKRINAKFYFAGKLEIDETAPLAHEGDLRAWGQQIGAQSVGHRLLAFHPDFSVGKEVVKIDGNWVVMHSISFNLKESTNNLKTKI